MQNQTVIPTAGMGATSGAGSDCYPYTIHLVDGKKMWVSQDVYTRTPDCPPWPVQEYTYSNNNQDKPELWTLCTLRKDGYWHFGTKMTNPRIHPGHRRAYMDPSF
jgi:hypothetical protein